MTHPTSSTNDSFSYLGFSGVNDGTVGDSLAAFPIRAMRLLQSGKRCRRVVPTLHPANAEINLSHRRFNSHELNTSSLTCTPFDRSTDRGTWNRPASNQSVKCEAKSSCCRWLNLEPQLSTSNWRRRHHQSQHHATVPNRSAFRFRPFI